MLSFFPRGVLDEILNLIESVSKGFPSYSRMPVHCIFTNLPEVIIAQVATTYQFSKLFYVKPKYILFI